jgi:hypothetical protein
MINIKIRIDADAAETPAMDIFPVRFYYFHCDHADCFSFCDHRQFFWSHPRRQYDLTALQFMG